MVIVHSALCPVLHWLHCIVSRYTVVLCCVVLLLLLLLLFCTVVVVVLCCVVLCCVYRVALCCAVPVLEAGLFVPCRIILPSGVARYNPVLFRRPAGSRSFIIYLPTSCPACPTEERSCAGSCSGAPGRSAAHVVHTGAPGLIGAHCSPIV